MVFGGHHKYLYQGFNNNSKSFLEMNDYRLFKRRLLEDAFPAGIKRISYYKEHENCNINKLNTITITRNEIGDSDLKDRESLIFKYYLRPAKIGNTEIKSIIRADGFYYEEKIPIKVIEREPRFEIEYASPSKELVKDEPMDFEYYIKYIGGDEDEKFFDIKFNPIGNNASNNSLCKVDPPLIINKKFSRGKTENIKVNVTYFREGYRFSPPTVAIGGKEEKFDADISVYRMDDQPSRLHYESLALKSQRDSNDIAWRLMIISLISIFISFISIIILAIEIYLIHSEQCQAKEDRKEHNIILEKLERKLK